MRRTGRIALALLGVGAGLCLLAALALGTWLYLAARQGDAPDQVVQPVPYPDAAPAKDRRAAPRFAVARRGDRFEIVDVQGRAVYLRGVNVGQGSDVPPWRSIEMNDSDSFRQLRAWGFNAIRLLVPWESLETEPRTFNLEHLYYLRWFLDQAHAHGMVVVLTQRQQDGSRCLGGAGAPPWSHRPGTIPQDRLDAGCRNVPPEGLAGLPARLRWWADFLDSRWTPDDLSLQDHAIWTWQKLAEVLRGHPALLGYEPLDAPPCSSGLLARLVDPMPSGCEAAVTAFYSRFAQAIRAVDPDALLFLDPPRDHLEPAWDGRWTALLRPPFPGIVLSVRQDALEPGRQSCEAAWDRDGCTLADFLDTTGGLAATAFEGPRVLVAYGVLPCRKDAGKALQHLAVDIEDASASAFAWNYSRIGGTLGMSGLREGGTDASLVVPATFADTPSDAGRARCMLRSLIRPYPQRVPGNDARWSFDRSFEDGEEQPLDRHHDGTPVTNTDAFTLSFAQAEPAGDAYVWIPRYSLYGDDPSTEAPEFTIDVSDGRWRWSERDPNVLVWTPNPEERQHSLVLKTWGGRRAPGRILDDCVP